MGAQESAIGNSSSHNNSEISPFSKKSTSLPPAVMEELLMIQKATLTKAGAQEDKKQLSQEEIEKLIYKKGDLESGS